MDPPSDLGFRFPFLESLEDSAPDSLDLTSAADLDAVLRLAEAILTACRDLDDLRLIERHLAGAESAAPVPLALAVAGKLALSKAIVSKIDQPTYLSIIFAVYKEHNRIKSAEEHPHGEDFLIRKINQLEWLFDDSPRIDWELIVVDDGCPDGSGKIAAEMVEQKGFGDRARVIFLEDAIREGLPVAGGLESTSDSQKGGAILYGMWNAVQTTHENHIVLFTDADLSTHLGQIGLLLDPLQSESIAAAIGSRREPASVVVKTGGRNTRGKLFIYLWKQLVSVLPEVIDTQCAFKAFRAEIARQIVAPSIEKKFAFDIELLVKTALLEDGHIAKAPLAWIDSEAASTTTELEPYLSMLQAIVRMYREYLPPSSRADPFAELVDSLDPESWDRLCENVPADIAEREPFEFGDNELVSAEQLREASC